MKNNLYEYIKTHRGVGHTRLLMDGALNAQYPFFVIGGDISHSNYLTQQIGNRFAIPVSYKDTNKMFGTDHPILIDNYVYTKTCEDYISHIRDQREEMERITKEYNKTLETIKHIPIWYRLFNKVFKKKIDKIVG